ncbi:ClpXP protease specificity-enhancing factor [soil metagenome]
MNTPIGSSPVGTSTRPYLIRALHDWCTDNGFTPYLAVFVDGTVRVPMDYVKNNEIVLNVGFEATSGLQLGNEAIEFKGRFGGVAREIVVPVDHVIAIYARENGQGMAFPVPTEVPAGMEPVGEPSADGENEAHRGNSRFGLRLASTEDAQEPESSDNGASESEGEDEPPEPTHPSGAGRPSLKRVK